MTHHPATFPDTIVTVLRGIVPPGMVLDPFAGIGTLGKLGDGWNVVAVELEQEWADQCRGNGCMDVRVVDATNMPFPDDTFDAIATSPAYGNRMADKYAPKDYDEDGRRSHRTRRSYRLSLGHDLDDRNGAAMQWGKAYRDLHWGVLLECARVTKPGGMLVVNVKDHIRSGKLQMVPTWWRVACESAGFDYVSTVNIPLKGDQNTSRHRSQGKPTVDHEELLVFHLGDS